MEQRFRHVDMRCVAALAFLTLSLVVFCGCSSGGGGGAGGTVDTGGTTPIDGDADGFTVADGDCDDADPARNPGAAEICDGIDNNCSGTADDAPGLDEDTDGVADCNDSCTDTPVGETVDVAGCSGSQLAGLPQDPAAVSPPLDPARPSTAHNLAEFLYTGTNPIQTGVVPGTIEPTRGAVLRGLVSNRSGRPLPGATVTVLAHPEFGQTLTRIDGVFDLAVNGGGALTVQYEKDGYLPVQRQVEVPWQNFTWLPDVVMIQLDPAVSSIDLTAAAPLQVARGSAVTDADGTRRATVLFSQGTAAELVLPDGSTQPLSTLSVRATEYTVGDQGPETMPASLPPASGYTYAVELSVDEAIQAGATEVRFDRPVHVYVENFLGFPTGGVVPVGYYDRQKAQWIASKNGRVVEILGVTGELADLDTDGDTVADDAATLASLDVSDAERAELASRYAVGESLWRVPVTHFSPYDFNWPAEPPNDAIGPAQGEPHGGNEHEGDSCNQGGSIIDCQNQTLGERIDLAGTPFSLNYRSNRVPGFRAGNAMQISLIGGEVPASLRRISLEVFVGTFRFFEQFAPAPDLKTSFVWDVRESYGRDFRGVLPVNTRLCYTYPAQYLAPADVGSSFAQVPDSTEPLPVTARQEVEVCQQGQGDAVQTIGIYDAGVHGFGGWTLDVHHAYDPVRRTLYRGDGTQRDGTDGSRVFSRFAGRINPGGGSYASDDGAPATEAWLRSPGGIAAGPDGSLYISDGGQNRIRRVSRDGTIETFAGTGLVTPVGDGGPAVQAAVFGPRGIAVGPDGSVYVAEQYGHRVRRIDPEGTITTVAGDGTGGFSGDGGLATGAQLNQPYDVAVGLDGTLYIADFENARIRQVGPDGLISTIAGGGALGGQFQMEGNPASQAALFAPWAVAVGAGGEVLFAEWTVPRLHSIGLNGLLTTVAGGTGHTGDGTPAVGAHIGEIADLAVATDGSIYLTDGGRRVRKITPDGLINTVAGSDGIAAAKNGGPATGALFQNAAAVAVGPDSSFYVADPDMAQIFKVEFPLPGFREDETAIVSADGDELYVFDSDYRHARTVDTLTGHTIYTFGYVASGLLDSVTDAWGNTTVVERSGPTTDATAIIGPHGQRTELTVDTVGNLTGLRNPAGETHTFSYVDADGLLASMTDPRGNTYRYTYDTFGRLVRDENPDGGFIALARNDIDFDFDIFEVTMSTAEGRETVFRSEDLPTGGKRTLNTFPDGTSAERLVGTDGSETVTLADGTVIERNYGPDPRWGMQASVLESRTVTTPGGLISAYQAERTVALDDPNDLLSLTTLTDTTTLNGATWEDTFDVATSTWVTTTPVGRQHTLVVGSKGEVVERQQSGEAPVSSTYDLEGRLSTRTVGAGPTAPTFSWSYDAAGQVERITDPLTRVTALAYDPAGRVTAWTGPGGAQTLYDYDPAGNPTAVTPPGRSAHTFGFSAAGRGESYATPDAGAGTATTAHTRNLDGQATRIDFPDGQVLSLAYDVGGRLSTATTAEGTSTFAYHPDLGLLASVVTPANETVAFAYDGILDTGTTWSGTVTGSVSRTYDDDLRVSSRSVNGGTGIAFARDADGYLTQAGALAIDRDPQSGRVASTTLGQVTDAWSYDEFGARATYVASFAGTELYREQLTRDALGRVTQSVETVGGVARTAVYTYDLAGHLAGVTVDGTTIAIYSYDQNDNRIGVTGPAGTTATTYDARDRLLESGSLTYTHGAGGELLTRTEAGATNPLQFSYDVTGNLTGATLEDGTQLDYVIDGRNRRIGKKRGGTLVQGFLYEDDTTIVAELDGAGALVSRFVYGTRSHVPDYLERDGATYRVISDQLGSPRLVVATATGQVMQRLDYSPFGTVTLDTSTGFQPFGFAGGLYDADTGLTHFGAREYDPGTGRWTTPDPILFAGGSSNLYGYVSGDPMNSIDPTGLATPFDVGDVNLPVTLAKEFDNAVHTGQDLREDFQELISERRREMERQTGEKYIHENKSEATKNYLEWRNKQLIENLKRQAEDLKRWVRETADRVQRVPEKLKKLFCGGG